MPKKEEKSSSSSSGASGSPAVLKLVPTKTKGASKVRLTKGRIMKGKAIGKGKKGKPRKP